MLTIEQFAASLSDSGLLSAEEVAEFRRTLARESASVQEFAGALVRTGRLTKYQARQAFDGHAQALVLGQYVLLDYIGAGGMGQVYRASHRTLGREVAIKTLSAKAVKSAESLKRFQREMRAAARLVHPNIVMAYDADQAGGVHFLVMEFVNGQDLKTIVKESGPLPVGKVVDYALQAARGLAYAHQQGVVHRDIKPANLLVDQEGALKILDMGLARVSGIELSVDGQQDDGLAGQQDDGLTQTGIILGTADYMSPEQAENSRAVDGRSDIYSLGCTLFCLLTGKPPFADETTNIKKLLAHSRRPVPSAAALRPEVPAGLDQIVQRMMAKHAADRQQSMQELIAELTAGRVLGAGLQISTANPDPGIPQIVGGNRPMAVKRRSSLKGYLIAGAVAAAVLVAIVIASSSKGPNPGQNVTPRASAAITETQNPQDALAHRVLGLGGVLEVVRQSSVITVRRPEELPKSTYRVKKLVFPPESRLADSDLAALAKFTSLESLELGGTRVSGEGFAGVAMPATLQRLYLSGCPLTAAGLKAVASAAPNLNLLALSKTPVEDSWLEPVSKLRLTTLSLDGTRLTDAGLESVGSLRWLTSLDLRDTKITPAGFFRIRTALPTCQLTTLPEQTTLLPDADGWIALFDGKALMGCHVVPAEMGTNWKVADGVLTSSGPACVLYSDLKDFTDLQFRCELKINAAGNSGMFARTGTGNHYEAEIIAPELKHATAKTGCLWYRGSPRLDHSIPVPSETWFTQEIIAVGSRIQIRVNGQVTVDYEDPAPVLKGGIALQHFSPSTVLSVRRMAVRRLKQWPSDETGTKL